MFKKRNSVIVSSVTVTFTRSGLCVRPHARSLSPSSIASIAITWRCTDGVQLTLGNLDRHLEMRCRQLCHLLHALLTLHQRCLRTLQSTLIYHTFRGAWVSLTHSMEAISRRPITKATHHIFEFQTKTTYADLGFENFKALLTNSST